MILRELIHNDDYARKVLPFIKVEYFQDRNEKVIYSEISSFINQYNNLPTQEALAISIGNKSDLKEEQEKEIYEILGSLKKDKSEKEKTDQQWLLDHTERFCQEKAIYNAVLESISILDNKKENTKSKGAIPQILSDALAVSFDPYVGHDYLEDSEERFEFYHKKETKIPFDLEFFNKITRGGLTRKTLNLIMGGVGVGKTLAMCHMASAHLSQGYNVLYITNEMAEEKIAERIDANLLNVDLADLESIPKELYEAKINKLKSGVRGKLIIKEYPTASASVIHYKALLNELRLKRNFVPQIIYIDYINICASSRIKPSNNVNSYTYIKMIAEEIRGLAIEFNLPIVSATQFTRSGSVNTDPDMTDTAESFGLPATVDLQVALIATEELEKLNQYMVKQLKNRYSDMTKDKRFVIGVDKSKMRLYDVEATAQADLTDSGQSPVMDRTPFGKKTIDYNKFRGLKTQ